MRKENQMTENLKYYSILGTNINVINMEKTVRYIEEHLEELKGRYICVSNVHTTVTAYRYPFFSDRAKSSGIRSGPGTRPASFSPPKH